MVVSPQVKVVVRSSRVDRHSLQLTGASRHCLLHSQVIGQLSPERGEDISGVFSVALLEHFQKARKLVERARARLRRELRKERQLEVFEKHYGEDTTNVFPPLRRKLSDHLRVQEAMSAGARKLQAMPITAGTSYHNFDLGADDH